LLKKPIKVAKKSKSMDSESWFRTRQVTYSTELRLTMLTDLWVADSKLTIQTLNHPVVAANHFLEGV